VVAVSVILPTFDRERFVLEAVASVRAQTFPDWELIVVDDGSTDSTPQRIAAIADPRVRLIRRDRCSGGAAVPRNEGLRVATGEWVAFLDSDDLWAPAKLELQIAALARSGADWCYSGLNVIDESGRSRIKTIPAGGGGWIARDLRASKVTVALGAVVARRDLAPRFCPSIVFVEDIDWVWHLAERGPAVAVDEPLLEVREHPGRAGSQRARPVVGRLVSWWLVYFRAGIRARRLGVWPQLLVAGLRKSRHVLALLRAPQ